MQSPAKSGRIDVAGKHLEAVWHGPEPDEAPTLVFLHEGLGCVAMWRDFPSRLAAATGCGALVYSRPGYGASDPAPPPWPLDFMQEHGLNVLPKILEECSIRQAILVGHSDGGSIAILHASSRTAPRVLGHLLEAPHVFVEPVTVASIASAVRSFDGGDLRGRLRRYHGANTDTAFRGWSGVWLDPAFLQWNIESYLPCVGVPTLLIQGKDDEYGTSSQVDSVVAGCAGPVQPVILEDCGHSPHRDQPEQVLGVMSDFVKRELLRNKSAT